MKITKSQKDAVISLLKDKFVEKNDDLRKEYLAKHAKEIDAKIDKFLALQNEAIELITRLRTIYELTSDYSDDKVEGELYTRGVSAAFHYYDKDSSLLCNKYTKEHLLSKIYVKEIEEPNYNIVLRELELATLGKDFDIDAFLSKYLPK